MSTIKTTHLQHPSASSPNLTLAADGSVSGGAGLGGLVHVRTETISSAISTLTIDNIFESGYPGYRMICSLQGSEAGTAGLYLRWREAGTTHSTATTYQRNGIVNNYSSGPIRDYGLDDKSFIGNVGASYQAPMSVDLTYPNYGRQPGTLTVMHGAGTSNGYMGIYTTLHFTSGNYDGFTLFTSTGTFQGEINFYRYANS